LGNQSEHLANINIFTILAYIVCIIEHNVYKLGMKNKSRKDNKC